MEALLPRQLDGNLAHQTGFGSTAFRHAARRAAICLTHRVKKADAYISHFNTRDEKSSYQILTASIL
ncbi:hypothetical protein Tdes44962_MAKER01678 [Teratosphaeria destructans]|uniref:Uncharacterized protein n=1 Tax=Teratosphaeria destructans TaxID=418781 RepID=A0A9W7SXN4_9PEZI|nr:hypothetical protein Tdes44962_MAKER01678 [Teratosphaeria destructans]